jgi:hypothetical protein
MKPTRHELKTWPEFFSAIQNGTKKFECRKNDRSFCVGDILRLKEWNPDTKSYTGRITDRMIRYILKGPQFGIEDGWCVMSID